MRGSSGENELAASVVALELRRACFFAYAFSDSLFFRHSDSSCCGRVWGERKRAYKQVPELGPPLVVALYQYLLDIE